MEAIGRTTFAVLALVILSSGCDDDGGSGPERGGGGAGSAGTDAGSTGSTSGGGVTGVGAAGSGGSGGTGPGGAGGAGAGGSGGTSGTGQVWPEGKVRYIERTTPADDVFLKDPGKWATWYQDHHYRMIVFSPFFDDKLSWYPGGWDYFDLYAIYANGSVITQHPEWVLRDGQGTMLYIPWGCSGGTCPQFAADISNVDFRNSWIAEAKTLIDGKGYRGLWIDDVNLDFRVSDGNGKHMAPIDAATGEPMTEDDWRKYMAEFTAAIRTALPNAEIAHNSIWYAGGAQRHDHPSVQKQIQAADYVNIEHGFGDSGITGGSGSFSLSALREYIADVQQMSRAVIVEGFAKTPEELEYSLANYLSINSGRDALSHQEGANPTNWWAGNDVDLGKALGPRTSWQGLERRDFTGGMVLINEPGAPTVTVSLPGTFKTLSGATVTNVTLAAKRGAVLLK